MAMAIRPFVVWLFVLVASIIIFSGKAANAYTNNWSPGVSQFAPGRVVAIDLGNTNACVAGFYGGAGVEAETMFRFCIPSWVAFPDDNGTVLVGEEARNHAAVNPGAAIYGFKRLFGKRLGDWFEQEFVQRFSENLPYKILEKDAAPHFQVQVNTTTTKQLLICVDEVTLAVFSKLKEMAESHLRHKVHAAIFSVPYDCHTVQCKEVPLCAGTLARFEAVKVLYKPIAAAIAAHDLANNNNDGKTREEGSNIFVLHIGGATTEATVMTLADGAYAVLGTRYDPFLGGQDFDQRTVEHFVRLIKDKYGKDIANDSAALTKLMSACELAKKTLSDHDVAEVKVDSLVHGLNLSEPLTRAEFEELNYDLFLRVLVMAKKVATETEMLPWYNNDAIDEVVLVGGSTAIPKLRELLTGYFKDVKTVDALTCAGLKPDEAVTFGATLYSKHLYLSAQQTLDIS